MGLGLESEKTEEKVRKVVNTVKGGNFQKWRCKLRRKHSGENY